MWIRECCLHNPLPEIYKIHVYTFEKKVNLKLLDNSLLRCQVLYETNRNFGSPPVMFQQHGSLMQKSYIYREHHCSHFWKEIWMFKPFQINTYIDIVIYRVWIIAYGAFLLDSYRLCIIDSVFFYLRQ
jgi:hypothetical protein